MPNYKFAVCGVASAVRVLKVRQMPQVGVTTSILNPDALDKPSFGGPGFNVFYGLTKLGIPVYPVLTYSDQSFETEFARISQEYGAFPTEFLDGPPDNISSRVVMIQDANRDHITMATRYGAETSEPLLIPQRFEEIPFDACELVVLTIPRPENIGALFAAVKKVESQWLCVCAMTRVHSHMGSFGKCLLILKLCLPMLARLITSRPSLGLTMWKILCTEAIHTP